MLAYTLKVETRERKREKKRREGANDGWPSAHTPHTTHGVTKKKCRDTLWCIRTHFNSRVYLTLPYMSCHIRP